MIVVVEVDWIDEVVVDWIAKVAKVAEVADVAEVAEFAQVAKVESGLLAITSASSTPHHCSRFISCGSPRASPSSTSAKVGNQRREDPENSMQQISQAEVSKGCV
jgi:hypothetical protein